jgi:hypothetical protein
MTDPSIDPTRYVDSDHLVETPESLRDSDPEAPSLDGGLESTDSYLAAEDFGTTAAEQQQGESWDQRLAQEEPDVGVDPGSPVEGAPGADNRPAEESALHITEG